MSFIASNWDWLTAIVGTSVSQKWVFPYLGRKLAAGWDAFRAKK